MTFAEPPTAKKEKRFIKLSSAALHKLSLKDGKNKIEFTAITKLQGKAAVRACVIASFSRGAGAVPCVCVELGRQDGHFRLVCATAAIALIRHRY